MSLEVHVRKHPRRRSPYHTAPPLRRHVPGEDRPMSIGADGGPDGSYYQRMYPDDAYVASIQRPSGPMNRPWGWEVYHHGLQFENGIADTQREAEHEADIAVGRHQQARDPSTPSYWETLERLKRQYPTQDPRLRRKRRS